MSAGGPSVYQFYAELADFRPKIWRRFLIRGDATMARLGYVLQVLFEMEARHLMAFELPIRENARKHMVSKFGKEKADLIMDTRIFPEDVVDIWRYEMPNEEIDSESDYPENIVVQDATLAKICHALGTSDDLLDFYYDFGDSWHVKMRLEEVLKRGVIDSKNLPCVIEGENFGIVEDVGGVPGLERLVASYAKGDGADYQHYRTWLDRKSFDISVFDKDDMNFRLKKIPRIYMQAYEQDLVPTKQSIDLINRKYQK